MTRLVKVYGEFICKKCNKSFKSNFSLWAHMSHCGKKRKYEKGKDPWNKGLTKETDSRIEQQHKNINEYYKKEGNIRWNKGLTKETDERIRKHAEETSISYKNGRLRYGCCSKPYLGSEKHKETGRRCGGYKSGSGRGHGGYVLDSYGKSVYLQSSFEIRLSNILNILNLKWIRPKYFEYNIDNHVRKYYPDFYLVDYDLYLDPKNDYLIQKDKIKIKNVTRDNNIKLFIIEELNITNEYIESICGTNFL